MRTFTRFQWLRWLVFLPAILWMLLIFGFSGENGQKSSGLSTEITTQIVSMIEKIPNLEISKNQEEKMMNTLPFIIRKAAHITEYGILYILLLFPLAYRIPGIGKRSIFIVLAFCFVFACLDEFHQWFVPGREGKFTDVMIDMTGVTALSIVFHCIS